MINRREFLEVVAAAVPALGWQGPSANEWGAPVFDLHFHLRPEPASNLAHIDGVGITKANLFFGSDCSCTDGRGGGVSQNNDPAASRMAGKCVARETLSLLKRSTAAHAFHKIIWGNAHKLLRIPA